VKSAVIVHNSDPAATSAAGNGNMPNKEVLADPLGALPTSHTKKYLPRQQTWAGTGSPSSPANPQTTHQIPPISPQTPSPTQRHGPPNSKLPFAKFQQMDSNQSQIAPEHSRLTRQASLPSLNEKKVSAPPPSSTPGGTLGGNSGHGGGLRRSTVVARSPSSAKEVILSWVQERTNTYPNLHVTNFSTSWNDGMAFCALIHYYYPEAFDYEKLDPKDRRYNFDLAFKSAEKYADICPLLDVEDMVMFEKPDWKCVFTYVQTFFRRFRNGRDPPVPTKKLTLTPPHISTPAPSINLAKSIEVSTTKTKESTAVAGGSSAVARGSAAAAADQPYFFPAPEISEEKKLSLMQKYLE